ncbi:Importin subunit beta-5 [Nakaseomyces bracarensis]|uniref:Importin subunit beta-5 n=1 Tax=Nakaseomyces bracarensis TaxID=273131 RepID=A0ABR4NUJ2_9SACH
MDFGLLIEQAQSPDNGVRENAETQLLSGCDANATMVFQSLTQIARESQQPLSTRQFALLSLRKLITMYWSPGFESYRNTSHVDPTVKQMIRDSLVELSLDTSQDTKVKNSSSYCIVQISATDFPDEWPSLLGLLYGAITESHSLNAIQLLNEIFDDVISEEMFFEGGIGIETLHIIFSILTTSESAIEVKTAALKLFNACLAQMSVLESHATEKRKTLVGECIPKALQTMSELLQLAKLESVAGTQLTHILSFKDILYENLNFIRENFPKRFFSKEYDEVAVSLTINDLAHLSNIYKETYKDTSDEEAQSNFENCTIHLLEYLGFSIPTLTQTQTLNIIEYAVNLCEINSSQIELWNTDFNEFVSKETSLSASFSVRDQFAELIGIFEPNELSSCFSFLVETFVSRAQQITSGQLESILYLIQCLISTDDDFENQSSVEALLEFIEPIITVPQQLDTYVLTRLLLIIPKILGKFMENIPNVKDLTKIFLNSILNKATASDEEVVKISSLIAFTYFANYAEISSVFGDESTHTLQSHLLNIIQEVIEDSSDDTNGLLMEVLNCIIDCNSTENIDLNLFKLEFRLILLISGKDPANIQVSIESQECLTKLLGNVSVDGYISYVDMCLPSFINIINGNSEMNYKYTPLLSLVLEFVAVFMKNKPSGSLLPDKVSEYVFEPLVDCLMKSTEEEVLQVSTEAFSYLIRNTSKSIIIPKLEIIVKVLDRLLSADITDSAAMNVGTLILAMMSEYSNEINSLLPTIIAAAVSKLNHSKNITTQQNLVSLLCFLTCHDPKQTIDFLSEFRITTKKGEEVALEPTMQKWFETFEIIRGENRIKENIVALSKLYFLQDPAFSSLHVNGDIIPYEGDLIVTRSMAKNMPDRYTQVMAPEKIIKLFIAELGFQKRQKSPEELLTSDDTKGLGYKPNVNHASTNENEADDEWEDVDEVLDYEKLQEYVDDEEDLYGLSDDDDDINQITGLQDIPQSIPELLKEFFKEIAQKNVGNFQHIYDKLSENERKIISETIL